MCIVSHHLWAAAGIVNDNPRVNYRHEKFEQVADAVMIAADYYILRDVVSTLADALRHSLDGELGRREPDVEEVHEIAQLVGARYQRMVASGCQCGLDSKRGAFLQKFFNPVEHYTPCFHRNTFRIKR